MKTFIFLLFLWSSSTAIAQSVELPLFPNQPLLDVRDQNQTKDSLFWSLDRKKIQPGYSQCFNRAQVWVTDMAEQFNVTSGKLWLFYTPKTGDTGEIKWWFHVAPIIADSGKEWVLEAGWEDDIQRPLTVQEWTDTFTGSKNCKLITREDTALFEQMFIGEAFPENYQGKKWDCYLLKSPAGYWKPEQVATHFLGKDENGKPVTFKRDKIDLQETYSACIEATTSKIGAALGGGKKKCARFFRP